MYVYMHCIYIYIHVYIYIMYIYICIYTCMYICILFKFTLRKSRIFKVITQRNKQSYNTTADVNKKNRCK